MSSSIEVPIEGASDPDNEAPSKNNSEEPSKDKSEDPSENNCCCGSLADWYRAVKKWCINEYGRASDDKSKALTHSIMLYVGAWVTVYAMNTVQTLYYTDTWFWFGSDSFKRPGALDLCERGESVLLAFPQSLSESLSSEAGVTNVLIGSYLTFTALLFLTSKLGDPSVFPVAAGHFRTLFNTIRMIAPVIATFFVPRVRVIGPAAVATRGNQIINNRHTLFAGVSFILAPLFEILSGLMDLIFFFTNKEGIGDNFIPKHKSTNPIKPRGERRRNVMGIIYKSLWVTLTVARLVVAKFLLFYFVWHFLGFLRRTEDPQIDACGTLRTIKTYVLEKIMIGLLSGMYLILAVTQMCESSGRRISSLFYIVPLLVICFVGIGRHFAAFHQSRNMEANYLRLLDIPESGMWPKEDPRLAYFLAAYPDMESDIKNCTALLDLSTVPDNCFELPKNPQ